MDQTYLTCDDLHVWLAPFTEGRHHYVYIELGSEEEISMIRIWNFNKSRIHSYRGVKELKIELDNKVIFYGEIQKAPGNLKDIDQCFETIMFTNDEGLIKMIEKNDWLNLGELHEIETDMYIIERPMTASGMMDQLSSKPLSKTDAEGRPITSAVKGKSLITTLPNICRITENDSQPSCTSLHEVKKRQRGFKCKSLSITILSNWGDSSFAGICELELIDQKNKKIPLNIKNLSAKPRDMNE